MLNRGSGSSSPDRLHHWWCAAFYAFADLIGPLIARLSTRDRTIATTSQFSVLRNSWTVTSLSLVPRLVPIPDLEVVHEASMAGPTLAPTADRNVGATVCVCARIASAYYAASFRLCLTLCTDPAHVCMHQRGARSAVGTLWFPVKSHGVVPNPWDGTCELSHALYRARRPTFNSLTLS